MGRPKESLEKKLWKSVTKCDDGCWRWAGWKNDWGYGLIWFEGRIKKAHRVSYTLHVGEIPEGLIICHKCDNPECVNPEHLFLGTHQDNSLDAWRKGRITREQRKKSGLKHNIRGDEHCCAKLTAEKVRTIRSKIGYGDTLADVANQFGVAVSTVCDLMKRRTWRHVE